MQCGGGMVSVDAKVQKVWRATTRAAELVPTRDKCHEEEGSAFFFLNTLFEHFDKEIDIIDKNIFL